MKTYWTLESLSCRLLAAACLMLSACDHMPVDPYSKEVVDITKTQKLCLIYTPVFSNASSQLIDGFHFDSLVWKTRNGTNWEEKIAITGDRFANGSPPVRSVTDVAKFDSKSGIAIIKVGIATETTNGTMIRNDIAYSWREWNLFSNRTERILRICKDPFDPLEGERPRKWSLPLLSP